MTTETIAQDKVSLPFFLKVCITATVVCAVDFVAKAFAQSQGLVKLNQGISFGLWPEQAHWWSLTALLILGGLVVWGWQTWRMSYLFLGLLIGGGVANAVDRLMFGAVRDWLPIPFIGVYNNLADWAIFVALCWFFAHQVRNQGSQQAQTGSKGNG